MAWMATVTKSIKASGGDYATVGSWDSAVNLNGDTDIWKGELYGEQYDESVTLDTNGVGTSSYQWLSANSAHVTSGVWNTSDARMHYGGGLAAVVILSGTYARADLFNIYRNATGSMGASDEGIRVNGDNCLASRMVIWTDEDSVAQCDGVTCQAAFDDSAKTFCMDNMVIYGWGRGGFHQNYHHASNTVNIDHSTIVYNGNTTTDANCGNLRHNATGSNGANVNIYNNLVATAKNGVNAEDMNSGFSSGNGPDYAGSHNASRGSAERFSTGGVSSDSTSSWQDDSTGTTDSTAATAFIVTDFTGIATFDFTPVDHANNLLLTNGTNRIGSEPDSRQDFSTDIAGNTRHTTNVDIGAFQISAAAGGADVRRHIQQMLR